MILSVSLGIHIISPSLINYTWTNGILPLSHISNHFFLLLPHKIICILLHLYLHSTVQQPEYLGPIVRLRLLYKWYLYLTFFFLQSMKKKLRFISILPTMCKECFIFTNKIHTFLLFMCSLLQYGGPGPLGNPTTGLLLIYHCHMHS